MLWIMLTCLSKRGAWFYYRAVKFYAYPDYRYSVDIGNTYFEYNADIHNIFSKWMVISYRGDP